MDPNVPPEVDDGSYEDMKTGKIDDKDKVLQYIGTLGLQISYIVTCRRMTRIIWSKNTTDMVSNQNGCRCDSEIAFIIYIIS